MKAKISLCSLFLAATLVASLAAAQDVDGYGPWRFGMSKDEVQAVEKFGPYTPVASTDGLETKHGPFMGENRNVSFVFGLGGLSQIQIWLYEGRSYDEAIKEFYRAYQHLVENFGPVHQDGNPWPADLTAEAFAERIPQEYRQASSSAEGLVDELKAKGPAQVDVSKLHLHPQKPVQGAEIYGSLLHSQKLGTYWVFLYYKVPAGQDHQVSAG
ncbi:MAG TPA: hypothetical protein VGX68_01205 [Thermoanaerobaculia bacterium]|jgi:hypothetical protein|nr:hypothetical protein [Thermoanaerobaculia bacterium]